MKTAINIVKLDEFDTAFGELGAKVGPRTGKNKRTQDEKDWYVVRRFLKEAIAREKFKLPLTITRGCPPKPDFVLECNRSILVEITEATNEADQREMTRQELQQVPILLGELGGRFEGGGGEPGYLWASDIVEAVERKKKKSIFSMRSLERHLVIYPNSNASSLVFNREDERRAFAFLLNVIEKRGDTLLQLSNGCLVHILGKEYVFFDILGSATRRRRKYAT